MDDDRLTRIQGRLERASLGVPLSRLIAQPPTADVLRAFAHACRQVDRAHACGIVHRDLRPDHIIISPDEVSVAGWEGAKLDNEDESTLARIANRYAVPERVADPRSDVYALGCILFEILAGEPLQSQPGAMLDTAHRSPSVRRPDRARAFALDAVCVAATVPDPARRLQTAGELADRIFAVVRRTPARTNMRGIARAAMPAYVISLLFVPMFLWLAAGERLLAIIMTALVAASVGLLLLHQRGGRWHPLLFASLNVLLVVMTARIASLMLGPPVAAITIAGMAFGPTYARWSRLAILAGVMCAAVLGLFFAEQSGWITQTLTLIPDGYALNAPVYHMRPEGRIIGFVGYTLTIVFATAILVHGLVRRERQPQ